MRSFVHASVFLIEINSFTVHNRDVSGALASLSSVAKLPYEDCLDGISNTFCIDPSALGKNSDGVKNLVSLLDGYFQKNAHHINVNVLNRALLEDAHLHPNKYPNLTIRVSGYAVRFNKLTSEQREEVLKRTMHGASFATFSDTFSNNTNLNHCHFAGYDTGSLDFDISNVIGRKEPLESNETRGIKGAVHSIETFSTSDGPGIRSLVFLQGCAKRCIYCSNPETQCIVDPYGYPDLAMSDQQCAAFIAKYSNFLRPNNGGVTLSGGEPLLQPDFVKSVFDKMHAIGLTTCLDTSGHGNKGCWDKVLPSTDYALLCLKAMDPDLAAFISGVSREAGERAKDFAKYIKDKYPHISLTLRWVLLEDLTDTDEELKSLVKFAHHLAPSFKQIELLPYHSLGREKYKYLKREYSLHAMEPYPYNDALRIKEYLEKEGVKVILAPL